MSETVKVKHSSQYYAIQKHKIVVIIIACVLFLGVVAWVTPIRKVVTMGVERVWIYIDEYYNGQEVETQKPLVEGLRLSITKARNINQYKTVTKYKSDLYQGNLVLVNNQHACKVLQGDDLISVEEAKNTSYKLVDKKMMLNREMLGQLNRMMKDFERDTGKHDMILTSGYRTVEEQENVLQEKTQLVGAEEARKWAMLPRYSEHHTGYAVDVSIYTDQGNYIRYKGQDEYGWINQNSYRYGLIRRYSGEKKDITGVADEEWHYRYVGVPHAYVITAMNFCFEEYIEYLKQYRYDTEHLMVKCDQGAYEIYFVPNEEEETHVPVPIKKEYSILGNNVDGYIVTVER